MTWQVGIDTGGTFTDVIAWNDHEKTIIARKIWTDREPAETIQRALASIEIPIDQVKSVTYGTTLITNTLVEGNIADVVLLTTEGFEDVLRIARQNRRVMYSMTIRPREEPLVSRDKIFGVGGRIDFSGKEIEKLDRKKIGHIAEGLLGNQAVAICFLNAYINPDHERAAREILEKNTADVCASHRVSAEAREYERSLITVMNAGLLPVIRNFRNALRRVLPKTRVDLFHSAGGMISVDAASKLPVALALSGPAAGVEAASKAARDVGARNAVSLDVGGTTTDVCLLTNGRPEMTSEAAVGAWPIRQPMVAVHSIGAGGGSLVTFENGRVRVGPKSAGANPGPACYERGGRLPTLTDAAAVLGYLVGAARLSDELTINVALAEEAIAPVAEMIGCGVQEAAHGIVEVANAEAARALRRVTVDKGVDLRECTLIAFGGAGPIFAAGLATSVGIKEIVVPRASSSLSALGCLLAERSYTVQRTLHAKEDNFDEFEFDNICADISSEVQAEIAEGGKIDFGYTALMHYSGQSHPIEVTIARMATKKDITAAFRRRHLDLYHFEKDESWEIEALRVRGSVQSESISLSTFKAENALEEIDKVNCCFGGVVQTTPMYHRQSLSPRTRISGPALVVDELSTIVIPPNCSAHESELGHIQIAVGG